MTGLGCEMVGQESHDLPGHLQVRNVRVQQQPIDTLHLERHVPVENLVDVRHRRHTNSLNAPTTPRKTSRAGRGPGGRACPPPANYFVLKNSVG